MTPLLPGEIVKQLRVYLPWHTDLFCNFLSTTSGSWVGTNSMQVEFGLEHNLSVGDIAVVKNMKLRNPITSATRYFDREDIFFDSEDIFFDEDHGILLLDDPTDLTLSNDPSNPTIITLSGFQEPEWNGEKTLISIKILDSGQAEIKFLPRPSVESGSIAGACLVEERPTFRGIWIATNIISPTEAILQREEMPNCFAAPGSAVTEIEMYNTSNIVVAPDIIRAEAMYTAQEAEDKIWLYVIPAGRRVSNDRHAMTDAIAELGGGDRNRLMTMLSFSLLVIIDTSGSIAAGAALDLLHGEIYSSIMASLFGFTNNACGSYKVVPDNDVIATYNSSYIAHAYTFEFAQYIDFRSGFHDSQDFAANKIEYIQHPGDIDNPETLKTTVNTR